MGSSMEASHALAGGDVGGRHPEQGEGDENKDKVEHGRSPKAGMAGPALSVRSA